MQSRFWPVSYTHLDVYKRQDSLGIRIAFSWGATILAAVVMSFPLMYRSARGALEQIDDDLIFAARTLGMSEWCIFFKVMIPNALPGIISGGVLAVSYTHLVHPQSKDFLIR